MNDFNDVLYEDNADTTLVLYDTKLLFINVHKLVLQDVNADVTLVLYDTKLLFMNVHKLVLQDVLKC